MALLPCMPKHTREPTEGSDIALREQPPQKKGTAADELSISDSPSVAAVGGEQSQDGDQDAQARRHHIDWTLEDVGENEKPLQLRYCSEQPPPLAPMLTGIPVYVDLPGGGKRNGLLKFNPVTTRFLVIHNGKRLNLVDFCECAIILKRPAHVAAAAASSSSVALSGWLPRDVLMETEAEEPAIPAIEHLAIPTRQWFIFNKDSILGQGETDILLPELATTTRRSRVVGMGGRAEGAGRGRAGAAAGGGGNASDAPVAAPKKKKEDVPPNPLNIPGWRFVAAVPDAVGVCLSLADRAPGVRLLNSLSASGNKGYRTVRATHGVTRGTWYFEITIKEDTPQTSELQAPVLKSNLEKLNSIQGHVRMGWARSQAELQAPVGYDRFGYGLASKTGDKVHLRKREPYTRPLNTGEP